MKKDLNYYLKLPYTIILEERNDGRGPYVAARIKELPGCLSHGATIEEAARDILDAKHEWLKSNLEENLPIPEPAKYTGQFHLRMPPELHKTLARIAEDKDVSLNQYLVAALSQAAGGKTKRGGKSKTRTTSR